MPADDNLNRLSSTRVTKYFWSVVNPEIDDPSNLYSTVSPVLNPWLINDIWSALVLIPVEFTLMLLLLYPSPPDSIVTDDKIFFSFTVVKYWLPWPKLVMLTVPTPARAVLLWPCKVISLRDLTFT